MPSKKLGGNGADLRNELRKLIDVREGTVIDALGGTDYEEQHLPEAIALVTPDVGVKALDAHSDNFFLRFDNYFASLGMSTFIRWRPQR